LWLYFDKIFDKMKTVESSQITITYADRLVNVLANRKNKTLKDLKGKIAFRDDYDYKLMRN
jgi:hypothetical protein